MRFPDGAVLCVGTITRDDQIHQAVYLSYTSAGATAPAMELELPPASVPEAVLLAEGLPQLLWLVDSGKPRARATREQLETLRHAKCRLVGAVLNHEPKPVLQL